MLECLVNIQRRDGAPLNNPQVTLGAMMPSMPMAHTIRPVKAAPTGHPGEYKGTLELQMSGVWAVEVDLSGPVRDKVVRNFQVDDCSGTARCAAALSAATSDVNKAHQRAEHHHGKQ